MVPILLYNAVLVLFLDSVSSAHLRLKKECGDFQCEADQYCAPQINECQPCEDICQEESNNYNHRSCENYCQEYIHDMIKGYAHIHRLEDEIITNRWLLILLLFLTVTINGGLVVRLLYQYAKRKLHKLKAERTYKQKLSMQYSTNNNNSSTATRDGALKCISQTTHTPLPSSTMTLTTQAESPCSTNTTSTMPGKTLPLSSEEPSEDNTLDYASYINQGMSHSPTDDNALNISTKY